MALLRMIVTNEARSFVPFCVYKILLRKSRIHLDIKIVVVLGELGAKHSFLDIYRMPVEVRSR